MTKPCLNLACLLVLFAAASLRAEEAARTVVWELNSLEKLGGHELTVLGAPRVIDAPGGKAIEFDGRDDGLFVAANPLAGLKTFTAEVIFRPAAEGPKEQRFLHFQDAAGENRVLFETRLTADGRWFLDTYIKSKSDRTLYAEQHTHPIGPWYHAAITMDGQTMRHYVNGRAELSGTVDYLPLKDGRTSLGVRQNKVFWYQGAIQKVRITPRVLAPEEFLKAP